MKMYRQHWSWLLIGILAWAGSVGLSRSATPPPGTESKGDEGASFVSESIPDDEKLTVAFNAATTAAELAQSATTSEDWSEVAIAWSDAIQALQAIPADNPEWLFAQRKTREYLNNQAIALQQVEQASTFTVFPPLGNDVLDEQLALYLSYVASFGPPDVMVIGSSRALQGINPQILQQRLPQRSIDSLRVYTFAVNGATAQVVSLILRRLLTADQLPHMIIWAGGSRSFNSGRVDRTFARILESPGYVALQSGDRPSIKRLADETVLNRPGSFPISDINSYGFLAIEDIFDPNTYYLSFPRVAGVYDSTYQRFNLNGVQTVSFRAIVTFTRNNDIPLVFVNLPLSTDYLDETRLFYERQFQQFLATESRSSDFIVIDLLQEWPGRNDIFADPSHLNQFGAAQVAIKLTEDPSIPWARFADRE